MSEQPLVHVSSPPCQTAGQQTALHRAAKVGNSDAVAALIQGGCAVDLQDRDGNTALHEVSWHGFSHCVKLLIKAGADVHIRNKAGNTALHLACQNAHAQTARLLLLAGSTPDAKNNVGDTCLHVAARYNNVSLVKILLSSLCPVAERNQRGDTALHVAAALNHKRTVQLLLEAGTDGTIRNSAGKTALDKARDNNHKEVALLLARAPQVHRFMRGRTRRKRRERLTAERRSQSVEILPNKALNKDDLRKGKKDFHMKKDLLCDDGEDSSAQNGRTYQLYTLYRDKNGNIRQAPANGCHCKPLLKKLEGQLKVTQEEMRLHILNVQEEVNSRLCKMDRRNRHQIKVLDMLNQERAAAERKYMIHRTEQRISQGREETLMTQLKDMDVHIPAKAQYYKLLPSPSVEQSVADADLESLPLLSLVSGDSSTSLATYVNILPSKAAHGAGGPEQEQLGSRTYFEMKVDRSPDDYENTALFPLPAENTSGRLLGSADLLWQPPGLQDGPTAAVVPLRGDVFSSSSSSQSSISEQGHRQYRRHCGELVSVRSPAGTHTQEDGRTLEFFIDPPIEPTFNQERNNLHAKEVTQRFFETVSTQLERWYERKLEEVEQQTALRTQQDRKELLQRISLLEEELQRLKTNENEKADAP
ncbi:ankyrin repeat domain-containing protein 6 [Symphorus nematophorus]